MATIFCFTSTGNSLFTAKGIAQEIGGKVRPMNNGPVQCADDVIGFVFPVYFWGLPRMAEGFISQLQITNKEAYVFAVITSGGPGTGVLGTVKKLLGKKGISLKYGKRIISVSNYLPQYEGKDSAILRQRAEQSITEISEAVSSRKVNGIMPQTPINRIAGRYYPKADSDKYFTVGAACTGCGTCEKVCPANNIIMDNHQLTFLHKCEHCLACVHQCPIQAIDWKQKTQGKKRYRNAGISLEELIVFNSVKNLE